MPGKLLLVDDDRFILNALTRLLAVNNYHCVTAVNAKEAWQSLQSEEFDLLILDVGLPDQDGISLCRRVRTKHHMPIIMLTARDGASDKVIALEVGADDYICKPFDPQEVLARVRAHLRRNQEYNVEVRKSERFDFGTLVIDVDARDAYVNEVPAKLTDREFELLLMLARNRGRAVGRDWLFEEVWGYDAELGIKTLAVYIRRVRMKVEADPDNPKFIQTVRGFGYKMTDGKD